MLQIILKESTAHLGSYTFLLEILINIKTHHFHSSINHQEQIFHRTLITGYFRLVNIAKILRSDFLIEHLQKQLLAVISQNRYTQSFANFTGKHLCWSIFLRNLLAEGLQLHKKDSIADIFL